MLIIALVLALVGLVALVFAVVTSNELVAWVQCASVLGVVLIIDAVQERRRRDAGGGRQCQSSGSGTSRLLDYPEEVGDDESATAAGTGRPSPRRYH
jgi:hypothetical protein